MQTADDVRFMAPAPDGVSTAEAVVVGALGLGVHIYRIVSHFPIGSVISEPFVVFNAPDTLDTTNYVRIVWEGTRGVLSYDLLRTDAFEFPDAPGNYALATGLTVTEYLDQGQALAFYDLSGMPRGAPVTCHVRFNNRDYGTPTLEFPCNLKVPTLIFTDGSMQWTAGGGGGSSPILVAGPGIALVSNPGPPPTITISCTVAPAGALGQVQFNGGGVFGASPNLFWSIPNNRLGIGTSAPIANIDVVSSGPTTMLLGDPARPGTMFLVATNDANARGLLDISSNSIWNGSAWSLIDPAVSSWLFSMRCSMPSDAVFPSLFSIRYMEAGDPPGLYPRTRIAITTNGNVGIGMDTPQTELTVVSTQGHPQINVYEDVPRGLTSANYNDGPHAGCLYLMKFRGTPAAPAPIQTGDFVSYIGSVGFAPGGFLIEAASITALATGVAQDSIQGELMFNTSPGDVQFGDLAETEERMRITSQGLVCIGMPYPYAPQYRLDVAGDINIIDPGGANGYAFRINGVAFTGAHAHVGTSPPASPGEGQLWFDDSVFKLFIRYSGAWIGLN